MDWQKELEKSQRISGDEEGLRRTIDRLNSYIGSFALRRGFNQSMDEFYAENPDEKKSHDEALAFRDSLPKPKRFTKI